MKAGPIRTGRAAPPRSASSPVSAFGNTRCMTDRWVDVPVLGRRGEHVHDEEPRLDLLVGPSTRGRCGRSSGPRDDALNTTSLILLFETGDKRMLFPGDAQIENWVVPLARSPFPILLVTMDLYKVAITEAGTRRRGRCSACGAKGRPRSSAGWP
jgi:hypothetical protein